MNAHLKVVLWFIIITTMGDLVRILYFLGYQTSIFNTIDVRVIPCQSRNNGWFYFKPENETALPLGEILSDHLTRPNSCSEWYDTYSCNYYWIMCKLCPLRRRIDEAVISIVDQWWTPEPMDAPWMTMIVDNVTAEQREAVIYLCDAWRYDPTIIRTNPYSLGLPTRGVIEDLNDRGVCPWRKPQRPIEFQPRVPDWCACPVLPCWTPAVQHDGNFTHLRSSIQLSADGACLICSIQCEGDLVKICSPTPDRVYQITYQYNHVVVSSTGSYVPDVIV